MLRNLSEYDNNMLIEVLWRSDPEIFKILISSKNRHESRDKIFDHLNDIEKHLFNIYSDRYFKDKNLLERNNAKECIRVLKNIIRTENEKMTGFSALKILYRVAKDKMSPDEINKGFIMEFIFLFRGINCNSGIYESDIPLFMRLDGMDASLERTKVLDNYSSLIELYMSRYYTGLDSYLIDIRKENKNLIQNHFNIGDYEWNDYHWHLDNVIKDTEMLKEFISLSLDELKGLELAKINNIPFQITPYYLSLFDKDHNNKYDKLIRAQVLPSENYCLNYIESKESGKSLDFMDEKSTSPIKGITRRYPQILILKPINACSQICQYCQRNWEIVDIKDAQFSREIMIKAINWIESNDNIKEVLITGGDPLILEDNTLDWLLSRVAEISHLERIRIGTRTLVTLPQRITENLVEILGQYNDIGKRELCMMTHFEHSIEMTESALESTKKLKSKGLNIYNQQVFTYYNSKKFESSLLRKTLKKCGIDPYYTFNTKGKEETIDYRVPLARIEQERKEETRFLPGIIRTDEPVFNVPRLGKSQINAWQDHEIIMILQDGRRVYRFYPWESKYALIEPYNYVDVSIYDYLIRLKEDGEYIDDYSSIWYYF